MSEKAEAKRTNVTAASRREEIRERYGREPNTNELRALAELPLSKKEYLRDTSATGLRIWRLLEQSERRRDVSLLDEAGYLLWEQVFRKPYSMDEEKLKEGDEVPAATVLQRHPGDNTVLVPYSDRLVNRAPTPQLPQLPPTQKFPAVPIRGPAQTAPRAENIFRIQGPVNSNEGLPMLNGQY